MKFQEAPYSMPGVNGWVNPLNLGRYGTDYNTRALIAWLGLGALTSDDAVYPSTFLDADGNALDGAKKYVLDEGRDIPLGKRRVVGLAVSRELLCPQRHQSLRHQADGKYRGRKPTARAKAEDAVRLFRQGKRVAHIAKELGIGRGSVYRALAGAPGNVPA
jgi:helix-turn-helix resolvase-like protein